MKCGYPVKLANSGTEVACGRCMNCRLNKQKEWRGRLLLEMGENGSNHIFVTATYNDDNVPEGGNLDREDLHKYMDRLQKGSMGKFRYFAVGEYGSITYRPHYHILAFNMEPSEELEKYFQDKWGKGFVTVRAVDAEAHANYITKYIVKALTDRRDPEMEGKVREFWQQSVKPPIGDQGLNRIKDHLYTREGQKVLAHLGDVPHQYRMAGKLYPIPRRYRAQWQLEIGIKKGKVHIDENDRQILHTVDYGKLTSKEYQWHKEQYDKTAKKLAKQLDRKAKRKRAKHTTV